MAIPKGYPEYLLHKMVRVMKGGEEVKMSKRAGSYVTLRDLIDWVGKDATRFFLVSRKGDTEFVFDVDLALSQSEENPVYYVQYAHARICSVLAQAAEKFGADAALDESRALNLDLSPLTAPKELALMQRLAGWPEVLRSAADELAPHQVAFALKDVGFRRLVWRTIPEGSTRTAELLAGNVDIITNVSPDQIERVNASATIATAILEDATGYGRVERDAQGQWQAIDGAFFRTARRLFEGMVCY